MMSCLNWSQHCCCWRTMSCSRRSWTPAPLAPKVRVDGRRWVVQAPRARQILGRGRRRTRGHQRRQAEASGPHAYLRERRLLLSLAMLLDQRRPPACASDIRGETGPGLRAAGRSTTTRRIQRREPKGTPSGDAECPLAQARTGGNSVLMASPGSRIEEGAGYRGCAQRLLKLRQSHVHAKRPPAKGPARLGC